MIRNREMAKKGKRRLWGTSRSLVCPHQALPCQAHLLKILVSSSRHTQPFPIGCTLGPVALSSKPLPIHSDSHPRGKLIVFNSPTHSTPHWETYFLPSRWSPYLPTIGFTPVLTCEPVSHWGYPTSPDSPSPSSNSASRWWLPVSSRLDYELSEGRTLLFIPSMITY